MPYVTSVERLARQEGRQEGREEGIEEGVESGSRNCARSLLFQTVEIRFGQVPDELRTSINTCTSTEQLSNLHRQALLAKSIDELPKQR